MKTKFYYLVLAVGVAMIAMSFVRKNQDVDMLEIGSEDVQEQEIAAERSDLGENYLEGVLYKSEDLSRGNLKLSSNNGDIYIRTSRDFSALMGFQVLVLINGSQDNFELLDIQSKIADRGFIQQQ